LVPHEHSNYFQIRGFLKTSELAVLIGMPDASAALLDVDGTIVIGWKIEELLDGTLIQLCA
jgi:hypothetical protein